MLYLLYWIKTQKLWLPIYPRKGAERRWWGGLFLFPRLHCLRNNERQEMQKPLKKLDECFMNLTHICSRFSEFKHTCAYTPSRSAAELDLENFTWGEVETSSLVRLMHSYMRCHDFFFFLHFVMFLSLYHVYIFVCLYLQWRVQTHRIRNHVHGIYQSEIRQGLYQRICWRQMIRFSQWVHHALNFWPFTSCRLHFFVTWQSQYHNESFFLT